MDGKHFGKSAVIPQKPKQFQDRSQRLSTLSIVPTRPGVASYYKQHGVAYEGDSGLDVYVPATTTIPAGQTATLPRLRALLAFEIRWLRKKNVCLFSYPKIVI